MKMVQTKSVLSLNFKLYSFQSTFDGTKKHQNKIADLKYVEFAAFKRVLIGERFWIAWDSRACVITPGGQFKCSSARKVCRVVGRNFTVICQTIACK